MCLLVNFFSFIRMPFFTERMCVCLCGRGREWNFLTEAYCFSGFTHLVFNLFGNPSSGYFTNKIKHLRMRVKGQIMWIQIRNVQKYSASGHY